MRRLSAYGAEAHSLLVLVALAWVANFLHFREFGYYEDDWYYFPTGAGQALSERLRFVLPAMIRFFQGRPMLLLFEALVGAFGKLGLSIPYLVVFVLAAATVLLFYRVLRMRFPRPYCLVVAALFALSPLTTVRQNLVIGSIMGPAFLCVFTAMLIRRRRPIIASVLAVIAVLTYEAVFLLYLAAPLLERGRLKGRNIRRALAHVVVCAGIVVATMTVRFAFGEGRVVSGAAAGPIAILESTISLIVIYIARSFRTFLYAAEVSWQAGTSEALVYVVGFSLWGFLVWRGVAARGLPPSGGALSRVRLIWWLRNGCALGLFLLALGYATIYFQTSGNDTLYSGRDTRFSSSSVPGSSMFCAALLMITEHFRSSRVRWIARGAFAAMMAVLLTYSFVIQDDYVRAWGYQKHLLSQLIEGAPDLQADGLIIIRAGDNPLPGFSPAGRPASIGWQRFGSVISLKCLGDWGSSPEVLFVSNEDWQRHLKLGRDGNFRWITRESPASVAEFVVPGRIIVFHERSDGVLRRASEEIQIEGVAAVQPLATNIALGKPARQSSTFGSYVAANGVDGHVGRNNSAWFAIARSGVLGKIVSPGARTMLGSPQTTAGFGGFHTNLEQEPWWEVDLQRLVSVRQVRVYNGQPEYFQRAASLRVLVSGDGTNWRLVYDNGNRSFGPAPLNIALPDVTARHLRVQLGAREYLHLEQVEVYGH